MKKLFFLAIAASLSLTACKNETKSVSKTEPAVAIVDNTKLGIDINSNPQGLAVGSQAPDLTFTLADGTSETLANLYKDQPIVVFFYRGYWCPVCNKHLSALAKQAETIEVKGVKLVAITPETYENVEKTKKQTGAHFTIISDTNNAALKAFGVDFKVTDKYQKMIQDHLNASIKETNGATDAVLPVPATYIIDTTGEIVYRQFNPDYKDRASVDDILAHLPK
ncbi:MAG: AhpC/TSA family protein [Flavobacteriales bacterium]|jgi:peroxiredoxin|nr:AhpC/TSA family protein [Flavobacteriales bacterium]